MSLIQPLVQTPVFQEGLLLERVITDAVGVTDPHQVTQSADRRPTDVAGLTDPRNVVQSADRRPADAEGMTDSLTRELVRPLSEAVGLTDSVSYLIFTEAISTDPMGLTDSTRQQANQSPQPTDALGLVDSLAITLYRGITESVGVTDPHNKTVQKYLADSAGIDDLQVQQSSITRAPVEPIGVSEVVVDVDAIMREDFDSAGITDSLLVKLIPPGRFRYSTLRPVFPGRGYVWSLFVKQQVGVPKAFTEVRFFDGAMNLLSAQSGPRITPTSTPLRVVTRALSPTGAVYAGLYAGMIDAAPGDQLRWDAAQWELGDIETAYGPKPDEILPGAVQSTMLALGAVTTDRVAVGAITNNLIAVGAITAGSIASGAVGSGALATDAVDNRVLADGSVNTSQLVVGSVVTGAIAAGAIITEKLAANAVTAGTIAAGAISSDKLAAGSVVAGSIAAGAIGAGHIAAGAVTAGKIAADAVTANEIAANSVTANEITAGAITTALLAASAVTASTIAANAITAGHIGASVISGGHIAADTILAGNIAADAIGASEIAANAVIAEHIVAGNILAGHVATGAVTTDKLSALAITAEKISAGAILAEKIATNAVTAGKINAGAVVSDSITSDAIIGKTLQGGSIRTNGTGTDRVEIVGATSLYDAVRWYAGFANGVSNYLAGEIRGYMGDIGAYGLLLNSHTQLGSQQSILYQVGKRKTRGADAAGVVRVRAGTVVGTVSAGVGGFQWEGQAAFDTVPSFVIATAASRAVMLRVYNISTTGANFEALVPGPSGGVVSIGDGGLTIHYYAEVTV